MKAWIQYTLLCFLFGYGMTAVAGVFVFITALQCRSLDGATNLAEVTPWYIWVTAFAIVGLLATAIPLGNPRFFEGDKNGITATT